MRVAIIGMGCTRFGERWDMGAEELMVAGHRYYTAGGPLPTTREAQSHLNRRPNASLLK
jgi:hypothetical protein